MRFTSIQDKKMLDKLSCDYLLANIWKNHYIFNNVIYNKINIKMFTKILIFFESSCVLNNKELL